MAQSDPIARFVELFERAKRDEPFDATAIALATSTPSGHPSVRIVLLKKVDDRGFCFFTNYGSRKARELEARRVVVHRDTTGWNAGRMTSESSPAPWLFFAFAGAAVAAMLAYLWLVRG